MSSDLTPDTNSPTSPPDTAGHETAQDLAADPSRSKALATRIPTLYAHESRELVQSVVVPPQQALVVSNTRALVRQSPLETNQPPPSRALAIRIDDDLANTRFQSEAIGIGEADVQIIVRKPHKPLIETCLPPLPFTERTADRGGVLPRASRATAVKWGDADADVPSEYRPIGSALDEAQVSIIVTGSKSEAQSRAERRALGVAPDREKQMFRFLKALSGD